MIRLLLLFSLALAACSNSEGLSRTAPAGGGSSVALTDPYVLGPHTVQSLEFEEGEEAAPKRTRVFAPTEAGRYPVIQFNHGFQGSIDTFQTLLGHLASHGFVVFAPQLVPGPSEGGNPGNAPTIDAEVLLATESAQWAKANLPRLVPSADIARYGVGGHSRGGQVMWRMLKNNPGIAQAITGVDPVDGNAPPFSDTTGPLVTAEGLPSVPSHTLGTGLGTVGGPFACAPANRNYTLFYTAASSPAWEVLAEDFGHADMVDIGGIEVLACASNPVREDMITFTAGQLAAFFSQTLLGMNARAFLEDFSGAPIAVSGQHK